MSKMSVYCFIDISITEVRMLTSWPWLVLPHNTTLHLKSPIVVFTVPGVRVLMGAHFSRLLHHLLSTWTLLL